MILSLQSDFWVIGVLGNWVIEEILIINYSEILIIKIIMANEKSFL